MNERKLETQMLRLLKAEERLKKRLEELNRQKAELQELLENAVANGYELKKLERTEEEVVRPRWKSIAWYLAGGLRKTIQKASKDQLSEKVEAKWLEKVHKRWKKLFGSYTYIRYKPKATKTRKAKSKAKTG